MPVFVTDLAGQVQWRNRASHALLAPGLSKAKPRPAVQRGRHTRPGGGRQHPRTLERARSGAARWLDRRPGRAWSWTAR